MTDSKCIVPVCHGSGEEKKFWEHGIMQLISCARIRGDGDFESKLQDIMDGGGSGDGGGDSPSVVCHGGCYCSYTSKQKIERFKKGQNRKS